jgi:predicted NUDIX family NTP pyrophosphohydrolase
MPKKRSAGLLMFRRRDGIPEVFLVHPGGPFWANKDLGSWSIPKGEHEPGEDALEAAKREFKEETGFDLPEELPGLRALGEARQPSGKIVQAWSFEGDCDPEAVRSNAFEMEWPPHSGIKEEFPEIDRAGWFPLETARQKILKGQAAFLEELERNL